MEATLLEKIERIISFVSQSPENALPEFVKFKAKYPPLLSGAHTRAFLSFALGSINLKECVEKLTKLRTPSKVCGALLQRHDLLWKCEECSIIPNCCFCTSCYVPAFHKDHKVSFSLGGAGTCDCGDPNCVKLETCCPIHSKKEPEPDNTEMLKILGNYISQATPEIIKSFVEDLHIVFCEICDMEPNNLKETLVNISNALEALGVIMECHSALQNIVCQELMRKTEGHVTKHKCFNEIPDSKSEIHQCKCTALQGIVRNIQKLSSYKNLCASYKEIAKKNSLFGKSVFEAYFAFYEEIALFNENLSQDLEDVCYQIIENKQFVQEVLLKYYRNYLSAFEKIVQNYITDKKKENTPLYFLYATFVSLIMHYHYNNNFLIEQTDFYTEFIRIGSKLQLADFLYGGTHIRGSFFITSIFAYGQIGYNFTNLLKTKEIFVKFKSLILSDYEKCNYKENIGLSSKFCLDNTLYRLLGIWLNKFVNYELDKNTPISEIRKKLCDLFECADLDSILKCVIYPTMQIMINACKYSAGYLVSSFSEDQKESLEIYYSRKANTFLHDLITIQNCITLLNDTAFIQHILFEYPFTNITDQNGKIIEIDAPKYLESIYHLIGTIILNETSHKYIYMTSNIRYSNRDLNTENIFLYRFLLRSEIMFLLMQEKYESEKFKFIQLQELIINDLPYEFRVNQIEDELSSFLSINSGKSGYTINSECLKFISLFNFTSVKQLHSFDQNYKNILSHLKISKLDIFEIMNNENMSKIKEEILHKLSENKEMIKKLVEIIISKNSIYQAEFTKIFAICILYAFTMRNNTKITEFIKENELIENLQNISKSKDLYDIPISKLIQKLIISHLPIEIPAKLLSEKPEILKNEERKQKQLEILKKFESQRKKFTEVNKDAILLEKSPEKQDILKEEKILCGICRENIRKNDAKCECKEKIHCEHNSERPFGQICFMSQVNILAHVLRQETEKISYSYRLKKSYVDLVFYDTNLAKISKNGLSLTTCGHYMHIECMRKYKEELEKNNKSLACPICKIKANLLIPYINENTKICMQNMNGISEIFKIIMKTFAKNETNVENFGLEDFLDIYEILQNSVLYMINSTEIIGIEHILKNQGILLGELILLFKKACPSYLLRKLYEKNDELKDTKSIFSCEILKKIINDLILKKDLKIEKFKEIIWILYNQSLIKCAFEHENLKKNVGEINEKNIFDEILISQKEDKEKIEFYIYKFFEKYILAYAILEKWDLEQCEKLIKIIENEKISTKFEIFGKMLNLNENLYDIVREISKITINDENLLKEILKYTEEVKQIVEKKEKIEDSKNKIINFLIDARISTKIGNLTFNLINLPEDYEQYLIRYNSINCENCGKNVPKKCVCLICGEIICYNSECCKNIEAVAHAVFCNLGRGVFSSIYQGNLILVSNMRSIEDDSGLYKNNLGDDVCSYLAQRGEKQSTRLSKYKLDKKKYDKIKEIIIQGQELQALDSAAMKNPQMCAIF